MALKKFHPRVRGARGTSFAVGLAERKALFAAFPVGSEISYEFNNESLGTVIGHDQTAGRLVTNQGGSFDPTMIKLFEKMPV